MKTEFAGFHPNYPPKLQPAPRIFKTEERVHPNDLPPSAYAERQGELIKTEIEDAEVPRTLGRVVSVCQVIKSGSGFIRVRWGECGENGSILAEYHFCGK